MHKSEINNVKKKTKKLYFMVFFDHLRADRFTGFGTGLPVIPIGEPVIPTGISVFCFSISKFQFRSVFVVTGDTGSDRFPRQYRFFIPWLR
jgi:hypothetical protein